MENLNAEQIKKALECCSPSGKHCTECVYFYRAVDDICAPYLMADALALINSQEQRIKELTEDNEAWQKQLIAEKEKAGKAYYELACEVEDLRAENERLTTALANYDRQTEVRIAEEYYTAEAYEELVEENERLREHCKPPIARNIDILKATVKADTVRKMQERLIKWWKAQIEVCVNAKEEEIIISAVDQIAKEMLEGKDEVQDT